MDGSYSTLRPVRVYLSQVRKYNYKLTRPSAVLNASKFSYSGCHATQITFALIRLA